jgi:hypothetical protein
MHGSKDWCDGESEKIWTFVVMVVHRWKAYCSYWWCRRKRKKWGDGAGERKKAYCSYWWSHGEWYRARESGYGGQGTRPSQTLHLHSACMQRRNSKARSDAPVVLSSRELCDWLSTLLYGQPLASAGRSRHEPPPPTWAPFRCQKFLLKFLDFLSHWIFKRMHEALNIDKK